MNDLLTVYGGRLKPTKSTTTSVTAIPIYYNKKLGLIDHFKTRNKMALGRSYSLGLVKRTSSFGRKRILILNEMDIDSIDAISPTKKRSMGNSFGASKSFLEALPQDILIRVLCGVEHDDLKSLFHVSKPIREAAMIAKKLHFEFSTPKKVPAFGSTIDPSSVEFDEIGAPRRLRVAHSRLDRKKLAALSVALFNDDEN
ncbi:hypothetical protein L1887_34636 [Cichorium endivia]|nr:hypothetical protein L1887_34636 [Cichorium endivia]